ncbi:MULTISPECIES: serine/threonine-protein kinase [unclassified Fibrobacter]|uniref:serine/threonine-protein kinase n=1 Tax=unclassified Fibrobacter TaxID=2634177 RepID=UPI0025C51F14|nr:MULTISPECIES: serine/threonine-protein kinase [unclassified Fibrobacter]
MAVAKKTKDALPKRIGGYTPTQMLGHGAMGNVWLCHDESLDRMVIVKQMVPKLLDQDSFIYRFQQEATILAHLNHPAIVVPYALWKEADGQLSLSMEFVMGKNLREILDVCKRPPVWVVMAILHEIFLALSAVHRAGIVHRDLKPANMMIDRDGRIRLLDFGVAHVDKRYEDDMTLTMAGSQIGTGAYMSPEQTVGDEATPASDLFSMGIIASEMLLGENVFRGQSLNETFQNIRRMVIGKKAFPPDTPKELVKLITRLLEKKPSKRPLSAADAAAELSRIMRIYPRDLTPYLADWVNSTMKGEKTTIEPETYANRSKLIIAITALSSIAVTAGAFLLISSI